MSFRINEGDLTLPKGWEDKTINAFTFPLGSKQPSASFAITRDQLKTEITLAAYVDKQLVTLAKSCPRFELVRRDDVSLDGIPAVQMEFTWRTPERLLVCQEQTIVLLPAGIVLTFTATAPKDKFSIHAAAFGSLVESFRFRREG